MTFRLTMTSGIFGSFEMAKGTKNKCELALAKLVDSHEKDEHFAKITNGNIPERPEYKIEAAMSDVNEHCDDADCAKENDGSYDVWGDRDGKEFRIRIHLDS